MHKFILTFVLVVLALSASTACAEPDARSAERELLRTILSDVESALNEGNFDLINKHLSQQVVITYYNAEVTRTPAEMQAYFSRMTGGDNPVVAEFHTSARVSAPAIFYGDDTAVAWGTTTESYKLAAGLEFALNGHWTATLHRIDGEWKIIALHFSSNLFDNPLLENAKRFTWMVGIVAFLSGLIIAFIITRVMRK